MKKPYKYTMGFPNGFGFKSQNAYSIPEASIERPNIKPTIAVNGAAQYKPKGLLRIFCESIGSWDSEEFGKR